MSDTELPREILTYLPAVCGKSFGVGLVAGEVVRWDLLEAWEELVQSTELCRKLGIKNYFDVDHDFKSRAFDVERLYFVPHHGIFASGCWSQLGLRLRPFFNGISPSRLSYSTKYPPPEKAAMTRHRQWEKEMEELGPDADWLGPIACVCVKCVPTFAGTLRTFSSDSPEGFSAMLNAEKLSYLDCTTP